MKSSVLTLLIFSICLSSTLCDDPPTTTSQAPTSTTPAGLPVLSFRVPENASYPACLRLNTSAEFSIKYIAMNNGTQSNASVQIPLDKYDGYDGLCANQSYNTLTVTFRGDWKLTFNYTLVNAAYYELNSVQLNYTVDNVTFPNANIDQLGAKSVMLGNLTEFSANKGNSYKCFAKTTLELNGQVTLDLTNYQAQPFLTEKTPGFDTAVECSADTSGTSKLVPIIVGSALAVLVVLVLIAYIIGRRKHRPGYQQV